MTRNPRICAAIDLGAQSGRVMLCRWNGEQGQIREIYRFPNRIQECGDHLLWDLEGIWHSILAGLKEASRQANGRVDSIGIDGWAVDYVLLDQGGEPIGPAYCYRDPRNPPQMERAFSILPRWSIYRITGIQFLPFNTLYQLLAHREEFPREWERTRVWLNLPEYFLFRLSGTAVSEFTNATHTQMVDLRARNWSRKITAAFDLDLDRFPKIVSPGTILGPLKTDLAGELRLDSTQVIAPACHDTGSTVAGIPYPHEHSAFISSGTWSLVGTVLPEPLVSQEAFQRNFTNEGGTGNTIRFLKNVTGFWLLQQSLQEWKQKGNDISLASLLQACGDASPDGPFFDIGESRFISPGNMLRRISAAVQEKGFPPENRPAELTAIILRSLARRYAEVIREVRETTGKRLEQVCIVGGGVKNEPLNRLTEHYSGLAILRGPSESAAGGNAAVQIAALEGEVSTQTIAHIAARLTYDETEARP